MQLSPQVTSKVSGSSVFTTAPLAAAARSATHSSGTDQRLADILGEEKLKLPAKLKKKS